MKKHLGSQLHWLDRAGVNFINVLRARFSYEIFDAPKITKLCYKLENFGTKKIHVKNTSVNIDEIDS